MHFHSGGSMRSPIPAEHTCNVRSSSRVCHIAKSHRMHDSFIQSIILTINISPSVKKYFFLLNERSLETFHLVKNIFCSKC